MIGDGRGGRRLLRQGGSARALRDRVVCESTVVLGGSGIPHGECGAADDIAAFAVGHVGGEGLERFAARHDLLVALAGGGAARRRG